MLKVKFGESPLGYLVMLKLNCTDATTEHKDLPGKSSINSLFYETENFFSNREDMHLMFESEAYFFMVAKNGKLKLTIYQV